MAKVLVTGCSRGIGRAVALALAEAGHEVVATARDVDALADLPVAERHALDVTDEPAIAALAAQLGELDVLVNNAGVAARGPVAHTPVEAAKELFDVNVWGPMRLTQALLPALARSADGLVVNVSSVAGRVALPLVGPYSASKWALEALSEALAVEEAAAGVRVVVLEPGYVSSGGVERSPVFVPDPPGHYGPLAERLAGMADDASTVEDVAEHVVALVAGSPTPLRVPVGAGARALLQARAQLDDDAFAAMLASGGERAPATRTRRAQGVSAFGERLRPLELPLDDPGRGEVLIRLVAAGAGLWDVEEAQGRLALPLPRALGWQGSGVVEAVGEGVGALAVGDRVVAYAPMAGLYADRVVVPAAAVVPAPASVPLEDAGALLVGASTAVRGLVGLAGLRRGQRVLITAGAGGTGTYAVELAKHLGAHVVTTAGPANHEFLRSLGADEVVDHHADDALEQIARAHPDGLDVLLDNVSSENFARHARLVRAGGVALGTHEPQPEAPTGVTGHLVRSWEDPAVFREVVRLVDEDVLHVRVGSRFVLGDAALAHERLRARRGRGAVLLVV